MKSKIITGSPYKHRQEEYKSQEEEKEIIRTKIPVSWLSHPTNKKLHQKRTQSIFINRI